MRSSEPVQVLPFQTPAAAAPGQARVQQIPGAGFGILLQLIVQQGPMHVAVRPEHPDDPLRAHVPRAGHALSAVQLGQIQPGFAHDARDLIGVLLHKHAHPLHGAALQARGLFRSDGARTFGVKNKTAETRAQTRGLVHILLTGQAADFTQHDYSLP